MHEPHPAGGRGARDRRRAVDVDRQRLVAVLHVCGVDDGVGADVVERGADGALVADVERERARAGRRGRRAHRPRDLVPVPRERRDRAPEVPAQPGDEEAQAVRRGRSARRA